MKIESLTLENFKRFKNLTIDFKNGATSEVANQFLILGDNGTGKTTVLQAIALCLSTVCRMTPSIDEFDWMGWLPGRYWQWGPPRIEMVVCFEEDEIAATREAALKWYEIKGRWHKGTGFVEPANDRRVKIGLDGEHYWVGSKSMDDHVTPEQVMFRGRAYAASIVREDRSARELFERLPGIFWFSQFRDLATTRVPSEIGSQSLPTEESRRTVTYTGRVTEFRNILNKWNLQKLQTGPRPGQANFLRELENHYKSIFPGRSFYGPEPMYGGGVPSPTDYYFLLNDGSRTYDIEEMSSGEQSVFPMLFDFVCRRINNSVVLIDEIDLNLHPPLAQALLASLPRLGPQCQFIFTTHSRAVSDLVSPHEVRRLEGGRPCL
jgi:predicted ATPase